MLIKGLDDFRDEVDNGVGVMGVINPAVNQSLYTGNAPQIEIAGMLLGDAGISLARIASFAATLGSVNISFTIPRIIQAVVRGTPARDMHLGSPEVQIAVARPCPNVLPISYPDDAVPRRRLADQCSYRRLPHSLWSLGSDLQPYNRNLEKGLFHV